MTKEICGNCTHWKPSGYSYGKCSEIGGALDIEIDAGWNGGVVDSIETEDSFGCNLFVSDGVYE